MMAELSEARLIYVFVLILNSQALHKKTKTKKTHLFGGSRMGLDLAVPLLAPEQVCLESKAMDYMQPGPPGHVCRASRASQGVHDLSLTVAV